MLHMVFPDSAAATLRLASPDVTQTELAEIAQNFPQLRPQVAAHPIAYDALLHWLSELRDPAVDQVLAARRSSQQTVPQPAPPSVPPAEFIAPPRDRATLPQPQALPQQPTAPPQSLAPEQPSTPPHRRSRRTRTGVVPWSVAAAGILIAAAGVAWGATAPESSTAESSAAAQRPGMPSTGDAQTNPDSDADVGDADVGASPVVEKPASTADHAIRVNLENWLAGDWDAAAANYAVMTYADNYDAEAAYVRLRSVGPQSDPPTSDPGYREIVILRRTHDAYLGLTSLTYAALGVETANYVSLPIESAQAAGEYVASLDPAVLGEFRLERIDEVASSENANEGQSSANYAAYAATLGAQEYAEYAALVSHEGQYWSLGVSVAKYDAGWLIVSYSGSLRGAPTNGLEQTTPAEYESSLEVPR